MSNKKSQNQIRKLCLQEAEQSTDLVGIDTKRIQRKYARTQIYWTRAEYNQSNSLKIQKHNRSNPFYQDFTRYYKWFVKWFFNYICGVSLDPRIAKQHSMHLYIVCLLKTIFENVNQWVLIGVNEPSPIQGRPTFDSIALSRLITSVFGSEECFEFRRGQEGIAHSCIRFIGKDKITSEKIQKLYDILTGEMFDHDSLKNCYAETTITNYQDRFENNNDEIVYRRKTMRTQQEIKSEQMAAEMAERLTNFVSIGKDIKTSVSISLPKTRFDKNLIYDNREVTHGIPTSKALRSLIIDKVHDCGISECDLKGSYVAQSFILADLNPPEDPYMIGGLVSVNRKKVKAITTRTISLLSRVIYTKTKITLGQLQARSYSSYLKTFEEYERKNRFYPEIDKKTVYYIVSELWKSGLKERLEKITDKFKVPAYYVFMHNEQQVVRMSRELAIEKLDNKFWCYGNNDSVIIPEFYKDEFVQKCFVPVINKIFNGKMKFSVK